MEDIKLQMLLDSLKADIKEFRIFAEENHGADKEDILNFLNDLETKILETEEG